MEALFILNGDPYGSVGTSMEIRKITDVDVMEDTSRNTMNELAVATLEIDKVMVN